MVASLWLCLLLTLDLGCATLSKSDRKKKPKEKAAPEKLPVVKEPGPTLTALDVLENYSNYKTDTSEKNFAGDVLGYVTPWNSHGYSRMDTSPMLMSPTSTNPIASTSIHHQNHQHHCIHIFFKNYTMPTIHNTTNNQHKPHDVRYNVVIANCQV